MTLDIRKRAERQISQNEASETMDFTANNTIIRELLLEITCLKVQVRDRGNSYQRKVIENEKLRATLKEVAGCETEHGTEKLCDGCLISIADALMTIPDCKTCTHYKAPYTQNQHTRDCTGYVAESV